MGQSRSNQHWLLIANRKATKILLEHLKEVFAFAEFVSLFLMHIFSFFFRLTTHTHFVDNREKQQQHRQPPHPHLKTALLNGTLQQRRPAELEEAISPLQKHLRKNLLKKLCKNDRIRSDFDS